MLVTEIGAGEFSGLSRFEIVEVGVHVTEIVRGEFSWLSRFETVGVCRRTLSRLLDEGVRGDKVASVMYDLFGVVIGFSDSSATCRVI